MAASSFSSFSILHSSHPDSPNPPSLPNPPTHSSPLPLPNLQVEKWCREGDLAAIEAAFEAQPLRMWNWRSASKHNSILHLAASYGRTDLIEFLDSIGFPIRDPALDWKGSTPLHTAAWYGQLEAATLLVQLGHPIDPKDTSGATPLHRAILSEKSVVATRLVNLGAASIDWQNLKGQTIAHLAVRAFRPVSLLPIAACGGRNCFTLPDNKGVTPFMLASCHSKLDVLKELAGYMGEAALMQAIWTRDSKGRTPLLLMAEMGSAAKMAWMLDRPGPLPLDLSNLKGQTPLHLVSDSGRVDIAELLIKAGTKAFGIKTNKGAFPLDLAYGKRHVAMLKLLLCFTKLCRCNIKAGHRPSPAELAATRARLGRLVPMGTAEPQLVTSEIALFSSLTSGYRYG